MVPYLPGILLFVLSVFLVAQSSITLYNYSKNKQPHDTNWYFTVGVLIFSLMGIFVGIYLIKKPPPGAGGQFIPELKVQNFKSSDNVGRKRLQINELGERLQAQIKEQVGKATAVLNAAGKSFGEQKAATAAAVEEAKAFVGGGGG